MASFSVANSCVVSAVKQQGWMLVFFTASFSPLPMLPSFMLEMRLMGKILSSPVVPARFPRRRRRRRVLR